MIYLDHNGTTPLIDEVRLAMQPFLHDDFGNPSSATPLGIRARDAVDKARERLATCLGADPSEILFTSGGTESNNTVIFGLAARFQGVKDHIVTTAVEHPATMEPCLELMSRGFDVTFVPVDGKGRVDPQDVARALRPSTFLVTVMHANNETGVLMPIREIGALCRERETLFHTDAAQSIGKVPVDVRELNIDFLSVAGHKLYAPKGIGALFVRDGVDMPRLLYGAAQEKGRRAGTENVIFDAAIGAAAETAHKDLPHWPATMKELRDDLEKKLSEGVPGLRLFGDPEHRLPNTLFVGFPDVQGGEVLADVPEIYASTGAACHSDQVKLSHVLAAMGVTPEQGKGAVRLTVGRLNSPEQIQRASDLLVESFQKVSAKKN